MHKKSAPIYQKPSSEEISRSKYCVQMIESFNSFQNLNNSNLEKTNFQTFINDFNNFISNETNINLLRYYLPSMLQEALKYSSKSVFQEENASLLFDIIDKILPITMDLNSDDISIFLLSLMVSIESIRILKKHIKALETLFYNDDFFQDFVNQQYVTKFFEKSFINFISVDLCTLFRHLICEISSISIRSHINLSTILQFLLTPIRPEIQLEYSIVLSKLISINSKNRLFLNNTQSFILFSNYIQLASSNIIKDCFNDLVFTPPFNLELFTNIILFYQKYPQHQNALFHWIFDEVIVNHADMLYEINNIIPFFSWITLSTPVSDVLSAISILSKSDISLTSPFISPLFSLLNKGGSTFEEYQSTIQIIEKLILLHQVSLNSLANSLFLKTFVINVEIDLLGQLFEKIYTFAQLVYDIYTLPQSEALRAEVINRLIQMAGKFPQNAHFISIFLVVSNSNKNISDLMRIIIENKNGDLCTALGDSFSKSDSVVRYFINGNGMKWLDKVYEMKIITFRQLFFLINSITKKSFIKEVDEYIESLPKTHPIFALQQEDIVTLCYGYEGAKNHFPLKIMSLFTLLESTQKVDPFNAYMVGKYSIEKFSNMEDLPCFCAVVNRYINDRTFLKVVNMKPEKLESFCDQSFDHFPLFQVYEFLDDNCFDVKFKSISFWFKFNDNMRNDLKIPFFHADKLQLFVKGQQLIANYEGVEYDADVNPFHWNNIIVVVSSQKISHYVDVYVNLNKAVFISSRQMNDMPSFEFSTYSALLFIGSAIRVYQNELNDKDTQMIYKNGPSFQGHLNESLIITPYSKEYLNLTKNVYPVKYRGFPVHFLSKRKMSLLFNRMIDSKCNEHDFLLLKSTCLKIYSMLRNSLHDFFRSILTIYSKRKEFVTSDLLVSTFTFFMKYRPKGEIIDTIIGHRKFWSCIPNDLIIISLLASFNDFDFYKEKEKLEIFLVTEAYFIHNNHKLFIDLVCSSQNCQTLIHELFTGSHFISGKQDKFTQCYIKEKTTTETVVDSCEFCDSNCVSIQCNLLNESEDESDKLNIDLICQIQAIQTTSFQKSFADLLKQMLTTTHNINFIPIDGVFSLFLTSDTDMKARLYPVLMNFEKKVPNSIHFDSSFLFCVADLYKHKEVWKETFGLLTNDSNEIVNHSVLAVIFALLWGYTTASIHSIASTGKRINEEENEEEMNRIINFLQEENNMKIVSNDKNVEKMIVSWFPFLLGYKREKGIESNFSKNEGNVTLTFKVNGIEVTSPSAICFMSMIWNKVIQETALPNQVNKEHYKELQSFIVSSSVFKFFFNYIFALSEQQFNEVVSSFLLSVIISGEEELSKCYACYFIHSLLNIVAESYTLTMNIDLIFPFVHFMCINGHITSDYLPTILSDLFLISSVIEVVYKPSFQKLVPHLNLLLLDLLSTSLKICTSNKDANQESNNKLINVLYQVLLQQVHFLIEIVEGSSKEKDLYILFFQESFRYCTRIDIYKTVITEFGSKLEMIDDPKFQSLISFNNFESSNSEKVGMNKMEHFIQNKIVPIVNDSGIHSVSFTNARDSSKLFTISFLKALNKQSQISENLPELFKTAQKFRNSKIDWNKTLHDIYQESNEKLFIDQKTETFERKKILMPFSMPLRIPRLFEYVPSFITENEIKNFIDEMNLYKEERNGTFKIKGLEENHSIFECQLKRLREQIQATVILTKRDILIIPFTGIKDDSFDASQFVKEVICGLWGHSIVYNGRITIRIPHDSVLFAYQLDEKSVAIWSISSGQFILTKIEKDNLKKITKLNERKNVPYYSSLRNMTLEKLIIAWTRTRLSNSQLLLGINMVNQRVFSDKEKFPLFPEESSVFGVMLPLNESLSKNICTTEFSGEISFMNTIEEGGSKLTQFITDKFMINMNDKDRKVPTPLFDSIRSFSSQKLNTSQLNESKTLDFEYNNDQNKLILNLPKLSVRISDEQDSVILMIDKGKQALLMYDYKNDRVICEERSSLLTTAKNLCVSENRFFFTIDFKSDITCIYQILYVNCSPKSFKFIRDISFSMQQETSISGVDWIAATRIEKRLVLWHFFPDTIHRVIEMKSDINFAKFDENSGTVWIVMTDHLSSENKLEVTFSLINLNGEILANKVHQIECKKEVIKVTSFSVIPQPISVNIREAVCGFSDGSIYFISVASASEKVGSIDLKMVKLESPHKRAIKKIITHPCTSIFVTVDSSNVCYMWTQKKEGRMENQFLDISAFESCASCGNENVSCHCKLCGRGFCHDCIQSDKICKDCFE